MRTKYNIIWNYAFFVQINHSQAVMIHCTEMWQGQKQFNVNVKIDVQTKMSLKLVTSTYKSFDLNSWYLSVISFCGIFTVAFFCFLLGVIWYQWAQGRLLYFLTYTFIWSSFNSFLSLSVFLLDMLVSTLVSRSVGRSFEQGYLWSLQACF